MLLTRNPCPLSGNEKQRAFQVAASSQQPAASQQQPASAPCTWPYWHGTPHLHPQPSGRVTGPCALLPFIRPRRGQARTKPSGAAQGVQATSQVPRCPWLAAEGTQQYMWCSACIGWDGVPKDAWGTWSCNPPTPPCAILSLVTLGASLWLLVVVWPSRLGAARHCCAPLSGSLLSFSGASILWCRFLVCFARHIVVSLCPIGPSLILPPCPHRRPARPALCAVPSPLCDARPSRPSWPSDRPPTSVPGLRAVSKRDSRRRRRRRRALCPTPTRPLHREPSYRPRERSRSRPRLATCGCRGWCASTKRTNLILLGHEHEQALCLENIPILCSRNIASPLPALRTWAALWTGGLSQQHPSTPPPEHPQPSIDSST